MLECPPHRLSVGQFTYNSWELFNIRWLCVIDKIKMIKFRKIVLIACYLGCCRILEWSCNLIHEKLCVNLEFTIRTVSKRGVKFCSRLYFNFLINAEPTWCERMIPPPPPRTAHVMWGGFPPAQYYGQTSLLLELISSSRMLKSLRRILLFKIPATLE